VLAGVSQSAVSLVLSGAANRHGFSQATQDRVRSAAQTLGYTPNHAASSLRRRRTDTITFVTADLGNRYFADVVAAAEGAAHAHGYTINIVVARTRQDEDAVIRRLCNGAADGLIIHGGADRVPGLLDRLAGRGIACVLLQDPGAGGPVPCVRADIEGGGFIATRHLLQLGHRRIAHITDQRMAGQSVNERLQGYRRALAAAAVPFDPALVAAGENSPAGGAAALQGLMAGPTPRPTPRPTAVFAFNDQMAFGAMHALASLGLRVPQDVAVVGFDGTDLGAYTTPALTSIDHPRQELGRLAADAVLDQLQGRPGPLDRVLPVRLLVRHSCGGGLTA
jgi:DNA-binding LacI/PurR family transcriptional regulator